jgi:hypothetical protein
MSVSESFSDALGCDIAARPRPVLHNKCLAEPTSEPFPYEARQNVGRATGGGADDDANKPRRIGLRHAKPETAGSAAAPAAKRKNCLRASFMLPSAIPMKQLNPS